MSICGVSWSSRLTVIDSARACKGPSNAAWPPYQTGSRPCVRLVGAPKTGSMTACAASVQNEAITRPIPPSVGNFAATFGKSPRGCAPHWLPRHLSPPRRRRWPSTSKVWCSGRCRSLICARYMRRLYGSGRALINLLCVKTSVEHSPVE